MVMFAGSPFSVVFSMGTARDCVLMGWISGLTSSRD